MTGTRRAADSAPDGDDVRNDARNADGARNTGGGNAQGGDARVVGRLAPSPTGRMHIGNVYAALAAWLGVRAANGRLLLRVEDIDAPRVVPDADRWIMDDLTWLGLDWDGGPVYQSQRLDRYEEALRHLGETAWSGGCDDGCGDGRDDGSCDVAGDGHDGEPDEGKGGERSSAGDGERSACPLVYPCFCSRADIRAASAPNEGDGFLVYPGTCRRLSENERRERLSRGDRHSWRIAVPDRSAAASDRMVRFDDRVFGPQRFDLARQLGDVVIRRSDGLFAYQLAVSVDDLEMGVTQVVRGRDLLRSTAIQLWIRRWLCACRFGLMGEPTCVNPMGKTSTDGHRAGGVTAAVGAMVPRTVEFAHLPLIDAADGRRMAKRLNSLDMGTLRERGVDAREVVGCCAWLLGLLDAPQPVEPRELISAFSWDAIAANTSDRMVDADAMWR